MILNGEENEKIQEDRKGMEIADIMSTTIIACIPMPTFGIHLEAKSMESTKR